MQLLGRAFAVHFLCLPAFSSVSFGRVTGTVTDQSGVVVSGVTLSVMNTEKGVTRTLTTDDDGVYNALNLTASNYTVRLEAKGFKRIERQSVGLEVGHEVGDRARARVAQSQSTSGRRVPGGKWPHNHRQRFCWFKARAVLFEVVPQIVPG